MAQAQRGRSGLTKGPRKRSFCSSVPAEMTLASGSPTPGFATITPRSQYASSSTMRSDMTVTRERRGPPFFSFFFLPLGLRHRVRPSPRSITFAK